MNSKQQDYKILQNIFKNADSKKRNCLLCEETSINSHLLQKNGILNQITNNNHIVQIEPNDFFTADRKGGIVETKFVGVNNAMSYNLFCNKHDTDVFKSIEGGQIDFNLYQTKFLFSYRALCSELRKKSINIDVYERILKAKSFETQHDFLKSVELQLKGNYQGVKQIEFYKAEFEKDINLEEQYFAFETIDLKLIPVCASAAYSPIDRSKHNMKFLNDENNRLNYIFINLIPYYDKLKLIIGYHKNQVDEWILNYIKDWQNIEEIQLTQKLTDLITTKIETWAISPNYFAKIDPKNLKLFKSYWNDNAMNLTIDQEINFDLFKNCS